MNARAYYNEIDPFAAQWLRNLIAAGHIAQGDVDERSIVDVRGADLTGYTQCHFFAGIGVWSYALRRAGWPDGSPVWTGSCPCQPFSGAGKGEAFDDERDLYPEWSRLIGERRPVSILGEQVASKVGLAWLDALHADLESKAYTVGAVDTCAAGFGCPGIRQRFYFVAYSSSDRRAAGSGDERGKESQGSEPAGRGRREFGNAAQPRGGGHADGNGQLGDAERARLEGHPGHVREGHEPGWFGARAPRPTTAAGPVNGFWADAEWIPCRDGFSRPIKPGTFPLAHGAPARVGRLRAYGNAINAEQAIAFILAAKDLMP